MKDEESSVSVSSSDSKEKRVQVEIRMGNFQASEKIDCDRWQICMRWGKTRECRYNGYSSLLSKPAQLLQIKACEVKNMMRQGDCPKSKRCKVSY